MDGSVNDLFGLAMTEYWEGRRDAAFSLRRDDDLVIEDPLARYFAEDPWPVEELVLDELSGDVLDIGCGAGRHLLRAQALGLDATGVEISRQAAALCHQRGAQRVLWGDINNPMLTVPAFDTALLFGNNIGIGGSYEGCTNMLRKLRIGVRDGGRVLLTGLDAASTYNPHHLAYHARNRDAGRPIGQLSLRAEYRGAASAWFQ